MSDKLTIQFSHPFPKDGSASEFGKLVDLAACELVRKRLQLAHPKRVVAVTRIVMEIDHFEIEFVLDDHKS